MAGLRARVFVEPPSGRLCCLIVAALRVAARITQRVGIRFLCGFERNQMVDDKRQNDSHVEVSFVIPVYNGSRSLPALVERVRSAFQGHCIEVVLVNDGSEDESEKICALLKESYPEIVTFLHLARNFGEHNAVLAGLSYAVGDYVAVLDDDGQNPPEEVVKMFHEIRAKRYDVVYGRYCVKRHGWFRNLGSWFNDKMANVMLKKPRGLYLSSFKIMNRFLVREVIKYRGAFPYIDGLIYRSTRSIGQVDVDHHERMQGKSNYSFSKLVMLWLNMFLNFSILPLRVAAVTGLITALASFLMIVIIWIDKFYWEENPKPGIPTVLCTVVLFGGVNLMIAGMLGEYLGRLYMDQTGTPQYVIRYVRSRRGVPRALDDSRAAPEGSRAGPTGTDTPADGMPVIQTQPSEFRELRI
jgi:glycosyltransferase involved in cell wall biosynthesis